MPSYIVRGREGGTFTYGDKTVRTVPDGEEPRPGDRISMPASIAEHHARHSRVVRFEESASGDVVDNASVVPPTPPAAAPEPKK